MSDRTPASPPTGRTLHRGRRFELREVDVPRRDGGVEQRELVVHPGAAVVLPFLADGQVVVIRQHRFALGRELLELVAGTLEPPEPPEACAARELREEAGYDAGRIEPLGSFFSSPGTSTERMHAFVARDLRLVGQAPEPTERIRVEVMPLEALIDLARQGQVEDGKTLAILGLYLLVTG